MNRRLAKEIASTVTNEQLLQMFNNAKVGVTDWSQVSAVNKGMTKGAAWNVLGRKFDVNYCYHNVSKINMIHEFGDFLPKEAIPNKPIKEEDTRPPTHQDPIFY